MAQSLTPYLVGGAALVALVLVVAHDKTPPATSNNPNPPASPVPTDINQSMLNAWRAAGQPDAHSQREAWISCVLGVYPLTHNQWGWVADQVAGFYIWRAGQAGSLANVTDSQVYGWVVTASQMNL